MDLLVVDDSELTRNMMWGQLRRHPIASGWRWVFVANSNAALATLANGHFDVVVTDWHLGPDSVNGISLARTVRKLKGAGIGIVVYSALDWYEIDRVAALEAGADTVMSAPLLHIDQLVAQAQALFRRVSGTVAVGATSIGDLEVDVARGSARVAGQPVELTAGQRKLLARLAASSPEVVSYEDLARALGYPKLPDGSHLVQEAMRGLRGALHMASASVEAVRGWGYRLVDSGSAGAADGKANS